MTDDELRQSYGVLRDQQRAAPTGPFAAPRPVPEAIWSALAGELEPGERVRMLDEALRTGAREEVKPALTPRPPVAVRSTKTKRTPMMVRRWWPVVATGVLVAMVSVTQLRSDETAGDVSMDDAVRYREVSLGAPVLVAPEPDTPLVEDAVFTWQPIPGMNVYTLEAVDADGRIVARVVTSDSTVTLPSSVSADARRSISGWRVLATTHDGAQRRSDLRRVVPVQRP